MLQQSDAPIVSPVALTAARVGFSGPKFAPLIRSTPPALTYTPSGVGVHSAALTHDTLRIVGGEEQT